MSTRRERFRDTRDPGTIFFRRDVSCPLALYKLFIAVFLTASPLLAAIPQSQRDALIAIYDATGGDQWTNHNGWKGPAGTECSWYGINCNTAGDTVTALSLEANNLRGTLPAAIGS